MSEILKIENLRVSFELTNGTSHIVNGLSLSVPKGHLVGLVGESGAGKSVAASAILGFVRKPGVIESGNIIYNGTVDLQNLTPSELLNYRGQKICLIAANARNHLNPLETVGVQIANVYMAHHSCTKKEAMKKAVEMLKAVGMTDPEQRAKSYPHELSGGMAQRCMIAMALINTPEVLIADDATNGLDVTVQAQIMDLILELLNKHNMSGIFITLDLGVVAQCCDEAAIMYCGQIVEFSTIQQLFKNPQHPYTRHLLNSLPEYRNSESTFRAAEVPIDTMNLPKGCLFHPRCPMACSTCGCQEPEMLEIEAGHFVKCSNLNSEKKGA